MRNQTEAEKNVAAAIEKALGRSITEQPHLKEHLDKIELSIHKFGDSMPGAAVISMPNELLINVKLAYSNVITPLKKQFPGYVVSLRRSGEIPQTKGSTPNRSREEILKDLMFPAAVVGRSTSVQSKTEMLQNVYLDGRQLHWSAPEMKTLENVLKVVFRDEYTLSLFTAAN